MSKYKYRSDFARRYFALGRNDARSQGRACLVADLLTQRFNMLPASAIWQLAKASNEELNAIGERLLTACTLDEALDRPPQPEHLEFYV